MAVSSFDVSADGIQSWLFLKAFLIWRQLAPKTARQPGGSD
jgi:hypothetical protein